MKVLETLKKASKYYTGWRPALGWVGVLGAFCAFVGQPVADALDALVDGRNLPPYPTDNLMLLVAYALGVGTLRHFDKRAGVGTVDEDPYTEAAPGAEQPEPAQVFGLKSAEPLAATSCPEPVVVEAPRQERQIAWGAKVSATFKDAVLWIEQDLGLKADYLMACMAFETGRKFSPSVKNMAGSSGTGLIQFMAATAKELGTTVEDLAKMTPERQLGFVWKYFRRFGKDLSRWNLEDTYMAILYPKAIGKPLSWTMPWPQGSLAYKQNSGLDLDRNGSITKYEASAGVRKMLELGQQARG